MPEARVESIDALKSLKVAMVKFGDEANLALGDAESEVTRTFHWLLNEQTRHWQIQLRKRTEVIGRCVEAVRMKKIFKDSSGRQQSAVEEEKALKLAQRKVEEAQGKMTAIRRGVKRLEKEIPLYKGATQRFSTDVLALVPAAIAHLGNLLDSLDAYTSLSAPVEVASAAPMESPEQTAAPGAESSMARAVDEEMEEDDKDVRNSPPQDEKE